MDWGSESTIVECKDVCPPEEQPNMVNHPRHYNRDGAIECIDEMELIYGPEAVMHFCLLSCHKYRYRAGLKNDGYEDLEKSDWYMRKYKELKQKIENSKSYTISSVPYDFINCSVNSSNIKSNDVRGL